MWLLLRVLPLRHRCQRAGRNDAGSDNGCDTAGRYGKDGFDHALDDCVEDVDGVDDGVCLGSERGEYDGEKDGERDDAEDVEVGSGLDCRESGWAQLTSA